ncbi:MAG: DsbA family protein [Candidatus Falkowbacteria bacterium]
MDEDKKQFLFGLSLGIAIFAVIGFLVMLGLYFKDNKSSEVAGETEQNQEEEQPNQPEKPTLAEFNITENDHIRGNFDAPITIVEFSDFQCPYCDKFHVTMKKVMETYPDKVRWVYKHFPLDSIHPLARQTAEASECANDQEKFWEYADKIYENQADISADTIKSMAKEIGLNMTNFNSCIDDGKYKDKVNTDYQEGLSKGVRGTPGNFVNGDVTLAPGAVEFERIKTIIDAELSKISE